MPVERSNGGSTSITGSAILGMRGIVLIQAMKAYLESNGKMQLTRIATPSAMRQIASEFTGKTYPRSRKGLETAYADMVKLRDGKTLDELGEVHKVNAEVGGIASDLQDD